jgi:hypothetical protein
MESIPKTLFITSTETVIKTHLHLQHFGDNASDRDTSTCLGHLGQRDRARIISIGRGE